MHIHVCKWLTQRVKIHSIVALFGEAKQVKHIGIVFAHFLRELFAVIAVTNPLQIIHAALAF